MRSLLLGFCLAATMGSCAPDDAKAKAQFPTVMRAGKTLDAAVIPTSYNESAKTQIRTEFASIVIGGARSVMLGQDSFIKISKDGKTKIFCVGRDEECYPMY